MIQPSLAHCSVLPTSWDPRSLFLHYARIVTLVILVFLGGGCATNGTPYAPSTSLTNQEDIDALRQEFASATSIEDYYSAEPETAHRRNEFIAGRLVLYDLAYVDFVTRFRFGRAAEATLFDTATLGVNQAITLFGGERTKEVLGAIGAALIGVRSSYERNFFEEQTAGAVSAQMNAERRAALVPIIAGMRATIEEYPLSVALVVLANYQYAGTLEGALSGIHRQAALREIEANADIERYREVTYSPDASTERIRRWLYPGLIRFDDDGRPLDAQGNIIDNVAQVAALRDELEQLGLDGLPISTFLTSATLAPLRIRAINDLDIP